MQIVHGDTDKVQFGMGTYGSRSAAVGLTAILKAMEKVEAKAKKIAAHQLEASENDIVIENGEFKVTGTDKSIALPMVALAAYTAHNLPDGMEPGLKEGAFYDPTNFTFPAGAYICEMEVDTATGKTTFVNFVAADDFGRLINPMIVEGQVHGGLAQGIGQALLEGAVYDSSGQLADGIVHGLLHAARRRPAVVQAVAHHDAVSGQSARRQGLRRGRRDRRIGGGHQRHHRCDRQQQARNARDARSRLACDSRLRGRNIMYQTTYHRPSSVDEAVALFAKGSDAKYLAGGHTLIPVMKQRLASPSDVIDLGKIKELVGIEASGDTLTIKAATTYFDVHAKRRREEGDPRDSPISPRCSAIPPCAIAARSAARSPTTIRRRIFRQRCLRSAPP